MDKFSVVLKDYNGFERFQCEDAVSVRVEKLENFLNTGIFDIYDYISKGFAADTPMVVVSHGTWATIAPLTRCSVEIYY